MAAVNRNAALVLFALLAVAAPLAFGAVDRVFQIALTLLLGAGLWAHPPALQKISPGLQWAMALFFVGLIAREFLPVGWFGVGEWRQSLIRDFQLPLGGTFNPEPARAFDAILVASVGAAFFVWTRSLAADSRVALWLAWALCVATFIFALVCLGFGVRHDWLIYGWRYTPGWSGYGPFPNRNHTASFLAIGALIACGCTVRSARRKQYAALGFGALAICVMFIALVESKSRGGIIAFGFGLLVFAGLAVAKLRSRAAFAAVLASLLISSGLLLAFGARLLARFSAPEEGTIPTNLRWEIWQDTLGMWKTAPLFGFGVETFARIFPFFQNVHLDDQFVIHPESSWLLWLVEFGAVAFALALLAGLVFAARHLRGLFGRERGFFVRAGAIAGVAALLFHSTYDVPAHRWATAGLGLALLAIACPLRNEKTAVRLGRGAAVIPLGIAIFWMLPAVTDGPGWSPLHLEKMLAASTRTPTLVSAADLREQLRWFPLEKDLHHALGLRELTHGAPNRAWDDFRIADRLSSSWQLPATQAWIALPYSPGMARHFWGLAIERAGHRAPEVFEMAYAQTAASAPPGFWTSYAREHPELLCVYAACEIDPAAARAAYDWWWQIRSSAPALEAFEKRYFYIAAERYGSREQLDAWMKAHPDWTDDDFQDWARLLHHWKDDAAAWALIARCSKEPDFPHDSVAEAFAALKAAWLTNPADAVNAQALAAEYLRRGDPESGHRVILKVAASAKPPAWFLHKAAYLIAATGDYPRAVEFFLREPGGAR